MGEISSYEKKQWNDAFGFHWCQGLVSDRSMRRGAGECVSLRNQRLPAKAWDYALFIKSLCLSWTVLETVTMSLQHTLYLESPDPEEGGSLAISWPKLLSQLAVSVTCVSWSNLPFVEPKWYMTSVAWSSQIPRSWLDPYSSVSRMLEYFESFNIKLHCCSHLTEFNTKLAIQPYCHTNQNFIFYTGTMGW